MPRRILVSLAMLLAGASQSASFNTEPGRLGCYQDTGARVWKQWRNTHQQNNVHFCRNMCQDFRFAGMEAGQWCMCGDELPPKTLPDARCKTACSGDRGQTCGGTWALEVFPVEPKPVMLGRPVGCFKDAPNRVWNTGLIKLQSNSPQRCFNSCRGFKYAGLEYGAKEMCDHCGPRRVKTCELQDMGISLACKIKPCPMPGQSPYLLTRQAPDHPFCGTEYRLALRTIGLIIGPSQWLIWAYKLTHWCVCGDHLPHAPLPATKCQTPCAGYPGKTCGGPWALDVFELDETVVTVESDETGQQIDYEPDTPLGHLGLYKLFAGRKTWDEAWQQCEDDDAHLLIINSEDEAAFVRSLFAQVPAQTRMHAGFHDLLRRGAYRTLFGKPLSDYTAWSPLFPSAPSTVQHCGSVDRLARLEQVDGNCGARAAFVCEKKSHSPDASEGALLFDPRGLGQARLASSGA